ncbi:MAG: hypothetical protein EXR62_02820 [Chloroflexi bacterium]|nr:hypothetical protein [Chloroflexota bacterium]
MREKSSHKFKGRRLPVAIFLGLCAGFLVIFVAQLPAFTFGESGIPVISASGLEQGGLPGDISGRVTVQETGTPLSGMLIMAIKYDTNEVAGLALTDDQGRYTVINLPPAAYLLQARPYSNTLDYAALYYPDKLALVDAQAVTVAAGAHSANIDFHLPLGGAVQGLVTRLDNSALISDVVIFAYEFGTGKFVQFAQSNSTGRFVLRGLAPGGYKLLAPTDARGYIAQYYHLTSNSAAATPLTITGGAHLNGIDFSLEPGGTIAGRVVDAGTGAPVANMVVGALDWVTRFPFAGTTDAQGNYRILGLPTSVYLLFVAGDSRNYVTTFYPNTIYPTNTTPVTVTAGSLISPLNFALPKGGALSGRVIDKEMGQPLANHVVQAQPVSGGLSILATTDTNGHYRINGVAVGSYKLVAFSPDGAYLPQFYNNSLTADQAVTLLVQAGREQPNLDFQMTRGGGIVGLVVAQSTGQPVSGTLVVALDYDTSQQASLSVTNQNGVFQLANISAGRYRVWVRSDERNYYDRYNGNVAQLSAAPPITITVGQVLTGLQLSLIQGAGVRGVVKSNSTGQPLAGRTVYFQDWNDNRLAFSAISATNGQYQLHGVAPGNYRVAIPTDGENYVTQYYNQVEDPASAAQVHLPAGPTVPGVDFNLTLGGSISGTLQDFDTAQPLPDMTVSVVPRQPGTGLAGAEVTQYAPRTDSQGHYRVNGLPPGTYDLHVPSDSRNYVPLYYPGVIEESRSVPIDISSGAKFDGIDFSLKQGGAIGGRVTDQQTASAIAAIPLYFIDDQHARTFGILSDAVGRYVYHGLPAGQYLVYSQPDSRGYVGTYYQNTISRTQATILTLSAGQVISPVNFSLFQGGSISGRITDGVTGAPVAQLGIILQPLAGLVLIEGRTGADGRFQLSGVSPGQYRLYVPSDQRMYQGRYYGNGSDPAILTVTAGGSLENINVPLSAGGALSGRVVLQESGAPVPNQVVDLLPVDGGRRIGAQTDNNGNYRILGVAPGRYRAFAPPDGRNYIPQFFDGTPEGGSASIIQIPSYVEIQHINFSLSRGGAVSGLVLDAVSGQPISNVVVAVLDPASGQQQGAGQTDENGVYHAYGVPQGMYQVAVLPDVRNYILQYWPHSVTPDQAQPVTVTLGAEVGGINFALQQGGAITGRLVPLTGSGSLSRVIVTAEILAVGPPIASVSAAADGSYSLVGLPPGQYKLKANSTDGRYYNLFLGNTSQWDQATILTVLPGITLAGMNFGLVRAPSACMPGDVNCDCKMDIQDIIETLQHWGATRNGAGFEDIYDLAPDGVIDVRDILNVASQWGKTCSTFTDATWSTPTRVLANGMHLNQGGWADVPYLRPDGSSMYYIYTACPGQGPPAVPNAPVFPDFDIFRVDRTITGAWSVPIRLGAPVNSDRPETSIIMTADGNDMYITRAHNINVPANRDIYVLHRQPNGEWGAPVNLGSQINTALEEDTVDISPDGKKLFFGRSAMQDDTGWVLMASERNDPHCDTCWSTPLPLPYPVNDNALTPLGVSYQPHLAKDNRTLLFASSARISHRYLPTLYYSFFMDSGNWTVPLPLKFPLPGANPNRSLIVGGSMTADERTIYLVRGELNANSISLAGCGNDLDIWSMTRNP